MILLLDYLSSHCLFDPCSKNLPFLYSRFLNYLLRHLLRFFLPNCQPVGNCFLVYRFELFLYQTILIVLHLPYVHNRGFHINSVLWNFLYLWLWSSSYCPYLLWIHSCPLNLLRPNYPPIPLWIHLRFLQLLSCNPLVERLYSPLFCCY